MTSLNELSWAFPECTTPDGALDLAQLSHQLGSDEAASHQTVPDLPERYELTWASKAHVKQELRREPSLTLAPVNDAEPAFAPASNLAVRGDPVAALQVLQRPLLGQGGLKMVYCHLPTDLDQAYATLTLVRPLLRQDGCCFILCDDAAALALGRKLGDEALGGNNFLATFVWQPDEAAPLKYLLMYARANYEFTIGRLPRTAEANQRYRNPDNDPRGPWKVGDLSVKTYSKSCDYPITTPSGRMVHPPKGLCWRLNQASLARAVAENRIWFGADGNNAPSIKRFLSELKNHDMVPTSLLLPAAMGSLAAEQAACGTELTVTAALARHLVTLSNLSAESAADDAVLLIGASAECAQLATALTALKQERAAAYRFVVLAPEDVLTWLQTLHQQRALAVPAVRLCELVPNARSQLAVPLSAYSQDLLATLSAPPPGRALAALFAYLVERGRDLMQRIDSLELCGTARVYQLFDYGQGQIWFCAEAELGVELIEVVAAAPQRPHQLVCPDASFASDSAKINCCERATLLLGAEVLVIGV